MRYDAVIFDFYGTLTVSVAAAERAAAIVAVADALGAPGEEFRRAWWASWVDRCTGRTGGLEDTLRTVAGRIGLRPDQAQVAEAAAVRLAVERPFCEFRPDAIDTLQTLRDRGLKTAVVSDCTHELPVYWPDLAVAPFIDAPVFSVDSGVKKPDPAIFGLATERLGVAPADCLFVGDGGSNELTGASDVGMTAVRILDHGAAQHRFEAVDWPGPVIAELAEVPGLLDGLSATGRR